MAISLRKYEWPPLGDCGLSLKPECGQRTSATIARSYLDSSCCRVRECRQRWSPYVVDLRSICQDMFSWTGRSEQTDKTAMWWFLGSWRWKPRFQFPKTMRHVLKHLSGSTERWILSVWVLTPKLFVVNLRVWGGFDPTRIMPGSRQLALEFEMSFRKIGLIRNTMHGWSRWIKKIPGFPI